jgi:hypothetical protein
MKITTDTHTGAAGSGVFCVVRDKEQLPLQRNFEVAVTRVEV